MLNLDPKWKDIHLLYKTTIASQPGQKRTITENNNQNRAFLETRLLFVKKSCSSMQHLLFPISPI